MKNLFFVLLVGCGFISCNTTKTAEQTDTAKPASTSGTMINNGSYVTADSTGTLTVSESAPESFQFTLTVVTANANCTGQMDGTADAGETNQWLFGDEETGCSLVFTLTERGVTVTEDGECDHGAACSFAGTYRQ